MASNQRWRGRVIYEGRHVTKIYITSSNYQDEEVVHSVSPKGFLSCQSHCPTRCLRLDACCPGRSSPVFSFCLTLLYSYLLSFFSRGMRWVILPIIHVPYAYLLLRYKRHISVSLDPNRIQVISLVSFFHHLLFFRRLNFSFWRLVSHRPSAISGT